MLYGGGFFIDQFFAGDHEGVVWVHGYGNVFEKKLEPGETIDIEPGGWLFRDHSVSMTQELYGFKTGLARRRRGKLVFNRFTGPGRVGLQSAYFHPPGAETGAGGGQAARRAAAAGCSAASSAGCSTTGGLPSWTIPPDTSPRTRFRPESSGALGLGGYQLLVDIAGVGAGRLGPQAFLLVAPDPDPALPDAGTQISLHQTKLRDEAEMAAFTPARGAARLPAPVGLPARARALRAAEQGQPRQPGERRDRREIPDKHPGRLFGGGTARRDCSRRSRALPPAGPAAGHAEPRAAAPGLAGAGAGGRHAGRRRGRGVADRALELAQGNPASIPPAAIEAAKQQG